MYHFEILFSGRTLLAQKSPCASRLPPLKQGDPGSAAVGVPHVRFWISPEETAMTILEFSADFVCCSLLFFQIGVDLRGDRPRSVRLRMRQAIIFKLRHYRDLLNSASKKAAKLNAVNCWGVVSNHSRMPGWAKYTRRVSHQRSHCS